MNKRLVERYRLGERVKIDFGKGQWQPAVVVEHAHPGLWVEDRSGRRWYVTNTRRIRRWEDAA